MLSLHLLLIAGLAIASYLPPKPKGHTILQSKLDPNVSISYKETHICETTPGVKSYSGYIHLPPDPSERRLYEVNMFFWFFESRKDPENAPLSLWLQGGPGVPSITAALGENGPCSVDDDSQNTTLNPWSWNNEVNMLYIDQPVQVGFSYDSLVNGSINQIISPVNVTVEDFSTSGIPAVNDTFLLGTFASQSPRSTANTTSNAALTVWHFLQTFLQEFPHYQPKDNKISLWTESYGGHYGPSFAELFENQNILFETKNGLFKTKTDVPTKPLHVDTLGIVNGCVDILTQIPAYPNMAYNNTYGLQIINETEFESAMNAFPQCQNLTLTCRSLLATDDPNSTGNNSAVNTACNEAYTYCFGTMWNAYNNYGRDVFDIAHTLPDSFPPKFAAGYLNQANVQQALGVPLNFTGESLAVSNDFSATGDFVRGGMLEDIHSLLEQGVKVALVYGDRDYQCNWMGGEAVSLAINSSFKSGFHAAGYANLETNDTYVGGVVRQYGNLSFTRVFDAGHEVPYYQPETAYRIFQRAMFNTDIATGKEEFSHDSPFSTKGPQSSFQIKNAIPSPQSQSCYLWDVLETCTEKQISVLAAGNGIIEDFVLTGYLASNGSSILY